MSLFADPKSPTPNEFIDTLVQFMRPKDWQEAIKIKNGVGTEGVKYDAEYFEGIMRLLHKGEDAKEIAMGGLVNLMRSGGCEHGKEGFAAAIACCYWILAKPDEVEAYLAKVNADYMQGLREGKYKDKPKGGSSNPIEEILEMIRKSGTKVEVHHVHLGQDPLTPKGTEDEIH